MKHALALISLCLAPVALGQQQVLYECLVFPELKGFVRSNRPHPAARWIQDGLFFQKAKIWHPDPPRQGEDDFYTYALEPFANQPHFFLTWRVQSNALRCSELPGVGGASIVAGGYSGIRYHFNIVRDQVRFVRGNPHPIVDVDFKRRAHHEYRLDIYSKYWFEWSLDGKVRAAGVPDKAYPTEDSVIVFGARATMQKTLQSWDFIRFGVPEPSGIECQRINHLKAFCRNGRIKAKVKSTLPEGTELTITNDGDHRTMRVKPSGRGKVKYPRQTGEHTILLLDCPHISQVVDCAG